MRTFRHVPIFQNAYKSSEFFEKVKMRKFPVRCRAIATYSFVQYKNNYAYGMSPQFTKTNVVCVFVCILFRKLLKYKK